MKALLCLMLLMTSAYAQDPTAYLKNFDDKVYSLKNKGVKDFVVEIESSRLTQQMNDQQLFGKVDKLVFKVFWTAQPERIAIEIEGLPEGFKEIKEDLKGSIIGMLDSLLPQTTPQRFAGYKLSQGTKQREIIAKDASGIAPIPSFSLQFDSQDKLIEVTGNKPVGTFEVKPVYEKTSFAEGKWVLKEQTTTSSENGQTLTVKKQLDYAKSQGIGVLAQVTLTTKQRTQASNASENGQSETLSFKNYKINEGVALKYFLGEAKANQATP